MSRYNDSPCCGTTGKYLVYFFMFLGFIAAFIAMILMFVGGGQIYGIDYWDYSTDMNSYPSNSIPYYYNSFVSCRSMFSSVWDNSTFNATADAFTMGTYYDTLETERGKEYAVTACLGEQNSIPPVYFYSITSFIMFVTAANALAYFCTQKPYFFYWVYALATVSLCMIIFSFALVTMVTSYYIVRLLPCNDMSQATFNDLGSEILCVFGREREDLYVPGSTTTIQQFLPPTTLPGASFLLTQVATFYAGLSLGLVAILIFISLFSVMPPKPELSDRTAPPTS